MAGMGDKNQAQSPLLQAAIAKAKANLSLGGQLPVDVQNATTRHSLAQAGSVAQGGGLGLGRDLVPRDLGLTSMDLMNQRLQQAGQLGGQELGMNQFNSQNMLNRMQMLQSINNQRFGQAVTAGQFGQGIQQPLVGLDPSSVANISMNNSNNMAGNFSNQANIHGQSAANSSKLIGYGLSGLMAYNNAQNPYQSTGARFTPSPSEPPTGY